MGVYERSVLELMDFPAIKSKSDSYWGEQEWTQEYISAAGSVTCFDTLQRWLAHIQLHGRENVPHDMGYAVKYREWIPNPIVGDRP